MLFSERVMVSLKCYFDTKGKSKFLCCSFWKTSFGFVAPCRLITAMLRLWRSCCRDRGRGTWTRETTWAGLRWPSPHCGATATVFTPSSAKGLRRTPLTNSTVERRPTWQVRSDSESLNHFIQLFVTLSFRSSSCQQWWMAIRRVLASCWMNRTEWSW